MSEIDKALAENASWDLLSKEKLFKRLKAAGVVKTKGIFDAWWSKRKNPVHELYAKPQKKFRFARITGPPYSYQIDTIRMDRFKRQNKGVDRFLLLVEINSRKAFAYVLKNETGAHVIEAYKRFLKDAGQQQQPVMVQGDDYFSAKEFVSFNDKKHIVVVTSVARDEHVTQGDPLGILDRCVQTLRSMIEKRIHARNDPKWPAWLHEVISDYNSNPHDTLKDETPNEVYADYDKVYKRWLADHEYNRSVGEQVAQHFKAGDYVRLRLEKGTFEKAATQTMSLEVYQVVSVKGTRISLKTYPEGKAVQRAAKANELLKVDRPSTAPAPQAITEAKRATRQSRRLAKEGLPEAPAAKEGDTVSAVVEVGKLAVIDAEGATEDSNRLTITQGGKTGYVFAGVVTKVTRSKLHLKLFERTGTSTALSQKRLKLNEKSQAIDNPHSDALLYTGDAPRIRSDGTASIPASVIATVVQEYVFS